MFKIRARVRIRGGFVGGVRIGGWLIGGIKTSDGVRIRGGVICAVRAGVAQFDQ